LTLAAIDDYYDTLMSLHASDIATSLLLMLMLIWRMRQMAAIR